MRTVSSSGKEKLKHLTRAGEKNQTIACSSLSFWWQKVLVTGCMESEILMRKGKNKCVRKGDLRAHGASPWGDVLHIQDGKKALLQVGTG